RARQAADAERAGELGLLAAARRARTVEAESRLAEAKAATSAARAAAAAEFAALEAHHYDLLADWGAPGLTPDQRAAAVLSALAAAEVVDAGGAEAAEWERRRGEAARRQRAGDEALARHREDRAALVGRRLDPEADLKALAERHQRRLDDLADAVGDLLTVYPRGAADAGGAAEGAWRDGVDELTRLDELRAEHAATADRAWQYRRDSIRTAQEYERAGDDTRAAEHRGAAARMREAALAAEREAAEAGARLAEHRRRHERELDRALWERRWTAMAQGSARRYGEAVADLSKAGREAAALPDRRVTTEERLSAVGPAVDRLDELLDGLHLEQVAVQEALRRAAWHQARGAHLREVGGDPWDDEQRADDLVERAARALDRAGELGREALSARLAEMAARGEVDAARHAEDLLAARVANRVAKAARELAEADRGHRLLTQEEPPQVHAGVVRGSRMVQADLPAQDSGVADEEIFAGIAALPVGAFEGDVLAVEPVDATHVVVRVPHQDDPIHFRAEAADLPADLFARTVRRSGTADDPHVLNVTRNILAADRPALLPRAVGHEIRHAVLHLAGVEEQLAEVAARGTEALVIDGQLGMAGAAERDALHVDRRALDVHLVGEAPPRSTSDLRAWREAHLHPGISARLRKTLHAVPASVQAAAALVDTERAALAAASRAITEQVHPHLVPRTGNVVSKTAKRVNALAQRAVQPAKKTSTMPLSTFERELKRIEDAAERLAGAADDAALDLYAPRSGPVRAVADGLRQLREELRQSVSGAQAAAQTLKGAAKAVKAGKPDANAHRALEQARGQLVAAVETLDRLVANLPRITRSLTAAVDEIPTVDRSPASVLEAAQAQPERGAWRYTTGRSRLAAVRRLPDRLDRALLEPLEDPIRRLTAVQEELRALDLRLTALRDEGTWPDQDERQVIVDTAREQGRRDILAAVGAALDRIVDDPLPPLLPEAPDLGQFPGGGAIADVLTIAARLKEGLSTAEAAVDGLADLAGETDTMLARVLAKNRPPSPDARPALAEAVAGVRHAARAAARLADHLNGRRERLMALVELAQRAAERVEPGAPPPPVAEMTAADLADLYAVEPVPAGMVVARSSRARAFAQMFPAAEGDFAVVVDTVTAPDGQILGFAPPGRPTIADELMDAAELWELTHRAIELSGRTDVTRIVLVASGAAALAAQFHELAASGDIAATLAPRGTVWLTPDGEPFVAAAGWDANLRRPVPAGPDAGWEVYTSDGPQDPVMDLSRPVAQSPEPARIVSLVDSFDAAVAAADLDLPSDVTVVVMGRGVSPSRLVSTLEDRIARGELPAESRRHALLLTRPNGDSVPGDEYGQAVAKAWGAPVLTPTREMWLRRDPVGRWRIDGGGVRYVPGEGLRQSARAEHGKRAVVHVYHPDGLIRRYLDVYGYDEERHRARLAESGARPGPEIPGAPRASPQARGIQFAERPPSWTRTEVVPGYVDIHLDPDGVDAYSPGELLAPLDPAAAGEAIRLWHEQRLLGPPGWFLGVRLPGLGLTGYSPLVARLARAAGVHVLVPWAGDDLGRRLTPGGASESSTGAGPYVRYAPDGRIVPYYATSRPALLMRVGDGFLGAGGIEPAAEPFSSLPERVLLDHPTTPEHATGLARDSGVTVIATGRMPDDDRRDLVRDGVWETPDGPVLAPEVGKFHEYRPDGTVLPYLPETWTTQRVYAGARGAARDEFGRADSGPEPEPLVLLGPTEPHVPHLEMDLSTIARPLADEVSHPSARTLLPLPNGAFPLVVEDGKLMKDLGKSRVALDVEGAAFYRTTDGGLVLGTTHGEVAVAGELTATQGVLRSVVDDGSHPGNVIRTVQEMIRQGLRPHPDGLLVFRSGDPDGHLMTYGTHVRPAAGRPAPAADLVELLTRSKALLLDFDGPITDLYAARSAMDGLARIRALLEEAGVALPPPIAAETNMVTVIRWAFGLGQPDLTRALEEALGEMDRTVVDAATPTPYALRLLLAARAASRPVAMVSNSSERAITRFLETNGYSDLITTVIGRAPGEPERWKPAPDPVLRAAAALGLDPEAVVLIGDEPADVAAARAAGARIIGYAKKPSTAERFAASGPDAVVESMRELAEALRVLQRDDVDDREG
ncbi:HAD family hydrolase, partial [Micromonospora sp. CPCC 206061]|uniref:HAD family hydrolase n=1 Tax=Micromonospora sp. CPCC 206061 TaxID=3122410 RepID=UPI002FF189B2